MTRAFPDRSITVPGTAAPCRDERAPPATRARTTALAAIPAIAARPGGQEL